jgi:hypothetical protein
MRPKASNPGIVQYWLAFGINPPKMGICVHNIQFSFITTNVLLFNPLSGKEFLLFYF